MQFSSFAEFIHMEGHGFYVWLSYGISLTLLALLITFSVLRNKNIVTQIEQRQKRELKLKQAAQQQDQNLSQEVNHESTS